MARHKQQQGPETVPVRLLVDWDGYRCGQYAELPAQLAEQLVSGGLADNTPQSVAYAKSLDSKDRTNG